MRSLKLLLFFVCIAVYSMEIHAQNCTSTVQINPTNPTTCGGTGSIKVTEYVPAILRYQWSLNGTVWFESETTQSGLVAGFYLVRIRDKATTTLCRSTTIELHPIDAAPFSGFSVVNATACSTTDGQITLNGLVATDSVSYISKINRTYQVNSSLSGGNKIQNLPSGTYYVRVKRAGAANKFCYTDKTITVGPANCANNTLCPNTSANLFPNGNFGAGTPLNGTGLLTSETQYGLTPLTCSAPDDGLYAISNTTDCNGAGGQVFNAWDITLDHTPSDVGGYMMVVNASFNPDIVIEKTIPNLCPNTEYEFSAWIKNICLVCGIQPNLTFLVDGVGKYSTGNLGTSAWIEAGFRFTTGASQTSVSVSIRNNAAGGGGNDWAIDDIFVGLCIPDLTILPPPLRRVCLASASETIGVIITDPRQQFDTWQWQESLDAGATWAFVGTPQTSIFNSSNQYQANYTLTGPLGLTYDGRKYRIRVASTVSNLASSSCSYVSPTATITIQIITPPVASASVVGPSCTNGVLALSATSTVASSTYAWSGPLTFTSTVQNPTITAPPTTASGTYNVTVTEPTGTCSATASVNATISAPPTPTAANNGPVCPGNSLNLTSSGGSTYAWTGPSNFVKSIQNPTIPFMTAAFAGVYTVTVTSAAGCTASTSTTVVVSASPVKPGTIGF
jgi:hypothetical protein